MSIRLQVRRGGACVEAALIGRSGYLRIGRAQCSGRGQWAPTFSIDRCIVEP